MEVLSEHQKIILNRLMNHIAHNDELLVELANEIEIEPSELESLVNIEF